MPAQTGYYDENGVWHEGAPPGSQPSSAPQEPKVTYTPDGVPRQPGFFNPYNPYDTGRPGESNRERMGGGEGGKVAGWDYDNGRPVVGTQLGEDGMYRLGGGGGGGGVGGGGPGSNPYYNQLASMYKAQSASEAASMRDQIRQMLVGLGLAPANFQDKFGALDPTTLALIQKNTDTGISTKARLDEQKGLGVKSLINRLNARGLRRSGARGYGLRKNQLDYDRNLSDVVSQMMQQVGGLYSNYTMNEYARQAALMNAAMAYASNTYQGGGGGGGGGGSGSTQTSSPSGGYTPTGGTITDYSGSNQSPGYGSVWPGWSPS
jgi:hypothetical protein